MARTIPASATRFSPWASARGVAVIDEVTTDEQLQELNGAGFQGARLNLTREANLDSLERLAARVKEYDWHLQLHLPASSLPENWPRPDVAIVPEDQRLLDALEDRVPDEGTRHRILVDNPAELHDF